MAFNPEFSNWFPVHKFRFWCQKVLPLVYDDSLSYYEILCKVVNYLNKYGEDLGVLAEEYKALVDYVNNYFESDMPAVIKQYVDEWLDEHPEATTTVQDGAITVAKLNQEVIDKIDGILITGNDLNDYTNAGKYIGAKNSSVLNKPLTAYDDDTKAYPAFNLWVTKVGDEVLQVYEVPETDYMATRIYSNGTWSDWKFSGGLKEGNETYNVRTTAMSQGVLNELLEVVNSYINHESSLFYGIGFGWDEPERVSNADWDLNHYGEQMFPDSIGRFKIDCSTLTWLLTSAIPWENSFYVGEENKPKYTWGYDWSNADWTMAGTFDIERGLANVMGFHCFKYGYAFKPKADFSNLKPGDLLFYNNSTEKGFWENIGHCSIFLGLDKEGEFISVEASENTNLPIKLAYNQIGSDWANQVVWCARLPISSNVDANNLNIAQRNTTYENKTLTGNTNEALYITNVEGGFEANRIYTAILKADFPDNVVNNDDLSLLIQGDVGSVSLQAYGGKLDDGIYKFMFTTYGVRADRVTSGRIACFLHDNKNDTNYITYGGDGATVYWFELFEGVYDTDEYVTPWNVINNIPSLQSAYSSGHSIAANGMTDVSITFPKAYKTTPVISLTKGGSSLNFSAILKSCNATGFTATLINHTSNAMTDRGFNWYAIGVNV